VRLIRLRHEERVGGVRVLNRRDFGVRSGIEVRRGRRRVTRGLGREARLADGVVRSFGRVARGVCVVTRRVEGVGRGFGRDGDDLARVEFGGRRERIGRELPGGSRERVGRELRRRGLRRVLQRRGLREVRSLGRVDGQIVRGLPGAAAVLEADALSGLRVRIVCGGRGGRLLRLREG
jgi:hypothetical protein